MSESKTVTVRQEKKSRYTHQTKKWMEVKLGRSLSLLKGFEPRILGSPAQWKYWLHHTECCTNIWSFIATKTCLNGRREILFPLGKVYHHTKGRHYLKTIKHNLSLQKATFKPLYSSGRGIVVPTPHQYFPGISNYRQNKLNKNFSAWSLNKEKQERAHKHLIVYNWKL